MEKDISGTFQVSVCLGGDVIFPVELKLISWGSVIAVASHLAKQTVELASTTVRELRSDPAQLDQN